ncbi:helix-turn-helix transcriptional regulator [Nocardioides panzhihuensis]|uniref:PAS domain S-box-containing protein n=1 Tax=Nocardioides panzhihuensis TaxID=860243 RepID=A0A7Z0DMV9_9ACTN|nr:helix-turn-helix domain-containing protein [Nocardioides panzhihuensis]NYI78413.1 PAS domain S-box-containing protein [Nocardioides panzhihuensis]
MEPLRQGKPRPELDDGLLAAVVNVTPTALWVIGADGTVQLANQAALSLLGYSSADEIIGSPSHETLHDHRPDGTAYPSEACPILDRPGSSAATAPEWFFTRQGRPLPVAWSTRSVGTAGARLLSFALAPAAPGFAVDEVDIITRDALRTAVDQCVRERFRDPEFTAADLASELHVSVRSVQALLAEDGRSPAAEIRRARLEFASTLLARGVAVSDACRASGFSEVGTFGRAFRRQFGQTPSSWARVAGSRAQ